MEPPLHVTIPAEEIDDSSSSTKSGLRSCFGSLSSASFALPAATSHSSISSSTSSSASSSRRRVRLNEESTHIHEPPAALQECLANPDEKQMLWYTGNDIRRMKQACVPVITKLDAQLPVPRAVEVDWVNGSTSTRGLEFGTKEGQARMRATRKYLTVVLEEQARLVQLETPTKEQDEEPSVEAAPGVPDRTKDKTMEDLIAAASLQASQPSIERALQMAVQDADFVCSFIENIHHSSFTPQNRHHRTTPLALMRKVVQAVQRKWVLWKANPPTAATFTSTKCYYDRRHRCDTESTATLMVQSS